MAVTVTVDPFTYVGPRNEAEAISFANANGYHWAYLDTCRENSNALIAMDGDPRVVYAKPIPDGWPYAWLEHTRRVESRLEIRDAFRLWRATGSLPGLD